MGALHVVNGKDHSQTTDNRGNGPNEECETVGQKGELSENAAERDTQDDLIGRTGERKNRSGPGQNRSRCRNDVQEPRVPVPDKPDAHGAQPGQANHEQHQGHQHAQPRRLERSRTSREPRRLRIWTPKAMPITATIVSATMTVNAMLCARLMLPFSLPA